MIMKTVKMSVDPKYSWTTENKYRLFKNWIQWAETNFLSAPQYNHCRIIQYKIQKLFFLEKYFGIVSCFFKK